MRLESAKGLRHAADARSAFIDALQRDLPAAAFHEVTGIDNSNLRLVQAWAIKWHINAPCVLEAVAAWSEGFRVSHWAPPPVPEQWRQRLGELSGRAAHTRAYSDLTPVISKREEHLERTKLAKSRELAEATEHPHGAHAAERVEQFLDQNLPHLQQQASLRAHEYALSPVSADPVAESEQEFLARAHLHWTAMFAEATRVGITAETRAPRESARDLSWLIGFQIHGRRYHDIAAASGASSEDTVRTAVERFARLIQLELRRQPKGRPSGQTKT